MNAISLVNAMPSTKSEIQDFVVKYITEIESGNYYPLEVEVQLKAIEETIKAIRSNPRVKSIIQDELYKCSENTIDVKGVKVTKANSTRWDFTGCEDETYNELKAQESELKETIKKREGFLKNLTQSVADVETGNIINPPSKTEIESYRITLKK